MHVFNVLKAKTIGWKTSPNEVIMMDASVIIFRSEFR